jgi:phospholipase C
LQPRTDNPLAGVTVPTSGTVFLDSDAPSHLQAIHAELVSRLPVADSQGRLHSRMPALKTSDDCDNYIRARTAAWQAQRQHENAGATKP